jgi:hypothetical protein
LRHFNFNKDHMEGLSFPFPVLPWMREALQCSRSEFEHAQQQHGRMARARIALTDDAFAFACTERAFDASPPLYIFPLPRPKALTTEWLVQHFPDQAGFLSNFPAADHLTEDVRSDLRHWLTMAHQIGIQMSHKSYPDQLKLDYNRANTAWLGARCDFMAILNICPHKPCMGKPRAIRTEELRV